MQITIHRSRAVKYEVETEEGYTDCTLDELKDETRFAVAYLNQNNRMWRPVGGQAFAKMVDRAFTSARYAPNEGVPK